MEPGCLIDNLAPWVYDPPIETVVFGFGVNEDLQLGLDTRDNVLAPKVVEALLGTRFRGRDFRRSPLIAGSRNTVLITADGELICFGWNDRATLGHGHREPERKPRRINGLKGVVVTQVALGGWHCLALDINGHLYAWGGNEYLQCAVDNQDMRDVLEPTRVLEQHTIVQVGAGGMHSVALTETGEMYQWGEPWGDFSMQIDRTPRCMDVEGVRFVAIACGAFHNLALDSSGKLWTWGQGDYGQLGTGNTAYATTPQLITEGLENVVVADIAAGGWHSACLSTTGEVYIWGRGEYYRLGLGDKTGSSKLRPTRVKALEGHRIVEVSCGGTHTLFITDDGRAFICGRGAYGRLGSGTESNAIAPVELKLPGGPGHWRIISGAAGGRHTLLLALPDNGDLHERSAIWQQLSRRSPPGSVPQSARNAVAVDRMRINDERSYQDQADDENSPEGTTSLGGTSLDNLPTEDLVLAEALDHSTDFEPEQQPQKREEEEPLPPVGDDDNETEEQFDDEDAGVSDDLDEDEEEEDRKLATAAESALKMRGLRDDQQSGR